MKYKALFFLLLMFIPASLLFAQVEKIDAAATPVATMGDISETQKGIITNRLLSLLSRQYQLVSMAEFKEAQDKAFSELDADQCTEEQCIRKIQDILQVDRLFSLQLIKDENITQLSLILIRSEDKLVRDTICENCGVTEMLKKIESLVAEITVADTGKPNTGTGPAVAEREPETAPEQIQEAQPTPPAQVTTTEEPSSASSLTESGNMIWHTSAIGLTTVSFLMAYNSANQYNKLASENQDIKEEYEGDTSTTSKASLQADYDSNSSEMKSQLQNYYIFTALTLAGISWETYLLFFAKEGTTGAAAATKRKNSLLPHVMLTPGLQGEGINLAMQWKW